MLREHPAGATCFGAVGTVVPVWRDFPSWRIRGYCGFEVRSDRDRSCPLAQGEERHVGRRRSTSRNQKVSRCAAGFAFTAHGLARELHQSNGGSPAAVRSPSGVPKGFLRPIASEPVRRSAVARIGRDPGCASSVYPRSTWQAAGTTRRPPQLTSRSQPVFRGSGAARPRRRRKRSGLR